MIDNPAKELSGGKMRRVKVKIVGNGFHPSEVLVSISTAEGGEEKLVVDRRSIEEDESIEIGYPIAKAEDNVLVELPTETVRGMWRIWIPRSSLIEEAPA